MVNYPNLAGINYESMVDGKGVRTAIFLSGCSHHCKNCQNPDTWNPSYGKEITEDVLSEISDEITKRDFVRGITLTGGDPLYDPLKTYTFLSDLKHYLPAGYFSTHDVWIYTGYTWENLKIMMTEEPSSGLRNLIESCDVMVDGQFIQDLADKRLKYRGSRNQRIINIKKSLMADEVVLVK